MAFGFSRERGTGRGYVNETNPAFAPGQRLSRRQYDKMIETLGARTHLPAAEAIRAAELRMETIRRDLMERGAALDARERDILAREAALAAREAEPMIRAGYRRQRQGAGQRRYNAALEAYVKRTGKSRREAAKDAVFREAVKNLKAKPNPRDNPNVAARNVARRRAAYAVLGGSDGFREEYERMFGTPVRVVSRSRGFGGSMRRRNAG